MSVADPPVGGGAGPYRESVRRVGLPSAEWWIDGEAFGRCGLVQGCENVVTMAIVVSPGPAAGSAAPSYFEVYLALTKRPITIYADTVECDEKCGLVQFYEWSPGAGWVLKFTIQRTRFVMAQRVLTPRPPPLWRRLLGLQ